MAAPQDAAAKLAARKQRLLASGADRLASITGQYPSGSAPVQHSSSLDTQPVAASHGHLNSSQGPARKIPESRVSELQQEPASSSAGPRPAEVTAARAAAWSNIDAPLPGPRKRAPKQLSQACGAVHGQSDQTAIVTEVHADSGSIDVLHAPHAASASPGLCRLPPCIHAV